MVFASDRRLRFGAKSLDEVFALADCLHQESITLSILGTAFALCFAYLDLSTHNEVMNLKISYRVPWNEVKIYPEV